MNIWGECALSFFRSNRKLNVYVSCQEECKCQWTKFPLSSDGGAGQYLWRLTLKRHGFYLYRVLAHSHSEQIAVAHVVCIFFSFAVQLTPCLPKTWPPNKLRLALNGSSEEDLKETSGSQTAKDPSKKREHDSSDTINKKLVRSFQYVFILGSKKCYLWPWYYFIWNILEGRKRKWRSRYRDGHRRRYSRN